MKLTSDIAPSLKRYWQTLLLRICMLSAIAVAAGACRICWAVTAIGPPELTDENAPAAGPLDSGARTLDARLELMPRLWNAAGQAVVGPKLQHLLERFIKVPL